MEEVITAIVCFGIGWAVRDWWWRDLIADKARRHIRLACNETYYWVWEDPRPTRPQPRTGA